MSPRSTVPNDDMEKSFDALCFVLDNPALSPAQAEQAWRWVEDQARGRREALESERRRKKERRDYLAAVKAENDRSRREAHAARAREVES